MTKTTLLDFQERAVDELLDLMTDTWVKSKDNSNYAIENPIVLASPTGSGKTLMVTEAMQTFKNRVPEFLDVARYKRNVHAQEILDGLDEELYEPIFIFVSPSNGELDKQSAEKIELEGSDQQNEDIEVLLNVEQWDEVSTDSNFEENTVIVLSWDKVNRVTNRSHKQTEANITTSFNLIVRKTRKNRPVIMFIDESHKNDTRKSKDVIDSFKPDILIKVSATPKESAISTGNTTQDNAVLVSIEEARKEKLIKDSIEVIAHKNGVMFNRDSVIKTAIDKRDELEDALAGETINKETPDIPLVLIQIENDKMLDGATKTNATVVKEKLIANGVEPEHIAVWLTDKDGFGKQNIDPKLPERINPQIRYLIFKTAIATGWDCPRAHILVKLRNVGSKALDIQTIGRIVRKANNKIGKYDDYDNAILKPAYIYVEDGISATDFTKETEALLGNFIVMDASIGEIKESFKEDVERFNAIELKTTRPIKAVPSLSKLTSGKLISIIQDSLATALNEQPNDLIFEETAFVKVSKNTESDIASVFSGSLEEIETEKIHFESTADAYSFFTRSLEGSLPDNHLFTAIMDTFKQSGTSKRANKKATFLELLVTTPELTNLLSEKGMEVNWDTVVAFLINNPKIFIEYTTNMTTEYKDLVKAQNDTYDVNFVIPKNLNVAKKMENTADNYLYTVEPNLDSSSNIEEAFANHLRESANIKWWFKNSNSGTNALGMYFVEDNMYVGYYPDFIFETTDGKLYIVDTKEGSLDNNLVLKYARGTAYKKSMQEKVAAAGYSDLVVSMVMRNHAGNFIINTGNDFEVPKQDSKKWKGLTF